MFYWSLTGVLHRGPSNTPVKSLLQIRLVSRRGFHCYDTGLLLEFNRSVTLNYKFTGLLPEFYWTVTYEL